MRKFIFGFIICLISLNVVPAQTNDSTKKPIFFVGGYIGLLSNFHNADFTKLEGYPSCCPKFSEGSGGGVAVGILFEYPLDDRIRLTARFGMASLNGELTRDEKIGNTEVRRSDGFENGQIDDAVSKYSVNSNLQLITLEPGVSYYPIPNLNLNAGFRFGLLNNSTFDQSETLISPNNVVFAESGTKARNEARNQEIPNSNTLQFHPFIGAGYDISIFRNAFLTPEIRYYLGLTSISDFSNSDIPDQYWKVNSLQLGASVKFPLFKPDEKKYLKEMNIIRDTVTNQIVGITEPKVSLINSEDVVVIENPNPDTEIEITNRYEHYEKNIPREAKLIAELKVTGLNRDGSRQLNPSIVIEETETEEGFPLLPYVFFKESDSNLNNTSMKQIGTDKIKEFDPNKLNWETLDIYSNLLNIIGYRMSNSKSSITLIGTNNNFGAEKDNSELSRKRAESVRDYLVNVWKIPSNRINIQSRNLPSKPENNDRPEGKIENQRVEIVSNDNNITAPLNLKDIVRTATPPKIEITPELWSEIGIESWKVDVSQKGFHLRDYSGTGDVQTNVWDIEDHPIPSLEDPVNIKLTYIDKAGKTGEITRDVKVSQLTIKKKRFELKDDIRIERFSLILFDYNNSDLTEAQKRILQEVKSKIKPNSKVTISGYADMTGEEQYNKELAARRNAEVQKVLKISDSQLILNNIGSSELLYDNSIPEGRSYCRTVKVIVETPVN